MHNAKVGANAVVTKDVPENAVMVGIPAKNVGTATKNLNLTLLKKQIMILLINEKYSR